ncbi:hypothetical protein DOT_1188 [Desulfosporosinus sp. OT]|nr:hypothetical protein DOT_1188 [Desulfosporosinus sp. OT]
MLAGEFVAGCRGGDSCPMILQRGKLLGQEGSQGLNGQPQILQNII